MKTGWEVNGEGEKYGEMAMRGELGVTEIKL